jgi:integrase
MSLTAKRVQRLLTKGEPCKVNDGRGLYLVVASTTNANWTLRYQIDHRKRWMGLGSALTFSLAQARERAQAARERLGDKVDPLEVRKAERAAALAAAAKRLTFTEAAQQWHAAISPKWSSAKHARNIIESLERWAYPHLGRLDVATIETTDVLRVLQQPVEGGGTLWTKHPTTADRLRTTVRQVLDWASVAGHRPGDLPNPARWQGHLVHLLPPPTKVAPVKNLSAMPYAQVPGLMSKLAPRESIAAQALRFLILSAARVSEVTNATWDEIDLKEAIWTVPASRMKARKEWRQPLSPQAIEILKTLPREDGNPHVFVGVSAGEALSGSAIRMLLRRESHGDIVAHGFRSSFSTWAHERTAHSDHTIELSLAHSVGNEVERAYRRTDLFEKRRRLLADWAKYCTTAPAEQKAGGKVIAIGDAR